MIYRISYLSDGLLVIGYLAIPNHVLSNASDITNHLRTYFASSRCNAEELACIRSNTALPNHAEHSGHEQLPILIYCRGGIGQVGKVKLDWLEQFVQSGHLVFAPAYRGNEGSEGRDEFGGADRHDVIAAYGWLCALPIVHRERVTLMGFSRGAINATLAAIQLQSVNKLILWSGVADLAKIYDERVDLRRMLKRVIGGSPAKYPEAYRSRSPIHLASQISCPVLVMHGTRDELVNVSHGLSMVERLREQQIHCTLHLYEGYMHHWPGTMQIAAVERMFAWIDDDMPAD